MQAVSAVAKLFGFGEFPLTSLLFIGGAATPAATSDKLSLSVLVVLANGNGKTGRQESWKYIWSWHLLAA